MSMHQDDTFIISGPRDALLERGIDVDGTDTETEIMILGTKAKPGTPPRRVKAQVYATAKKTAGRKQRTVPPMVRVSIGGHASASVTGQTVSLPIVHEGVYYGIDFHYVSGPTCSLTAMAIDRENLIQFNAGATVGGTAGAAVGQEIDLAGEADVSGGPIVYRFLLNPDNPAEGQQMDDSIPLRCTFDGGVATGAPSTVFNTRIWKDVPKYGKDVRIVTLNA